MPDLIYQENSFTLNLFRYFDIREETREFLLYTGATYNEVPFLVPIAQKLAEHDKFVFETG